MAEISTDNRPRFTLRQLLGWFVVAGAYCAVIASLPTLLAALGREQPPEWWQTAIFATTWSVVAWGYVRGRFRAALAVHFVAPALMLTLVAFAMTYAPDLRSNWSTALVNRTLMAAWLGTLVSLPLCVMGPVMKAAGNLTGRVATVLGFGSLGFLLLGVLPAVLLGSFPLEMSAIGAGLGSGLGLLRSLGLAQWAGRRRILGVRLGAVGNGALCGGLLGFLSCWIMFAEPLHTYAGLGAAVPGAVLFGFASLFGRREPSAGSSV